MGDEAARVGVDDGPEGQLAWHLDMALSLATGLQGGDVRHGLTICIQQLQGVREWQKKAGVRPTAR